MQYGVSLITGYIERDREKLYSSCIVISEGEIVHNYRFPHIEGMERRTRKQTGTIARGTKRVRFIFKAKR